MSPRGSQQKQTLTKIDTRRVSPPDDVKFRMIEVERQRALDTRTDLEKFFGDPPPNRPALAQRNQRC
jgi:hypothetical protein